MFECQSFAAVLIVDFSVLALQTPSREELDPTPELLALSECLPLLQVLESLSLSSTSSPADHHPNHSTGTTAVVLALPTLEHLANLTFSDFLGRDSYQVFGAILALLASSLRVLDVDSSGMTHSFDDSFNHRFWLPAVRTLPGLRSLAVEVNVKQTDDDDCFLHLAAAFPALSSLENLNMSYSSSSVHETNVFDAQIFSSTFEIFCTNLAKFSSDEY